MSTEVTQKVAGLAGLAAGLRRTKQQMPSFGGKSYMAFGKDGMWTLGKDKRTDRSGENVIMNINTLKSGYVNWTNHPKSEKRKNEKLGEEMMLATLGSIDPSTLPETGWEWKQQQLIEGRFLQGDNEEFSYNTSSMGGLEAMDGLLDAVMIRIEDGEEVYLFPVVELANDWYEHGQYGKTYKPIFEIIGWADVEGTLEGAKKAVTKAETEEQSPVQEPDAADEPMEDPDVADADENEQAVDDEPPVRRRRR